MPDIGTLFQSFLPNGADVHIFDRGVSQLLRAVERRQLIEPLIRHLCHPDVGFAWIGICLSRKMGFSENAKQRGFAYLRQANDASFHKDKKMITVRSAQ